MAATEGCAFRRYLDRFDKNRECCRCSIVKNMRQGGNETDSILYGDTGPRSPLVIPDPEPYTVLLDNGVTNYFNSEKELVSVHVPGGFVHELTMSTGNTLLISWAATVHFQHGVLHREDGPAVEYDTPRRSGLFSKCKGTYWLNGKPYVNKREWQEALTSHP